MFLKRRSPSLRIVAGEGLSFVINTIGTPPRGVILSGAAALVLPPHGRLAASEGSVASVRASGRLSLEGGAWILQSPRRCPCGRRLWGRRLLQDDMQVLSCIMNL